MNIRCLFHKLYIFYDNISKTRGHMWVVRVKSALASLLLVFSLVTTGFLGLLIFEGVRDLGGVEAAKVIYVDSAGGSEYTTIQEAVDNASTGDTIIVANGTYYESVLINVTNVTLKGNSSSACKIIYHYDGSHELDDYAAVINVTASGVNITGFNISATGNYSYGIRLNSTAAYNSNITNNNISTTDMYSHAIFICQSSNNAVKNNKIDLASISGYGIYLSNSTGNNLINNSIEVTGSYGIGIFLIDHSKNNTITNNTITTINSWGTGIYLQDLSNNNNLTDNIIKTYGSSGGDGILIYGSSNNNLNSNEINTTGYRGHGIYLQESSNNNTLIQNIINSWAYGIYLYFNSNDNKLVKNNITTYSYQGYGIYLYFDSGDNKLIENNITTYSNRGYGIYIRISNRNNIIQNRINTSQDYGYGIYLDYSINNSLINNTIDTGGTEAYGIFIYGSPNNNLTNNTIKANSKGIYLFSTPNVTISRNNLTNCGIFLIGGLLDHWNSHEIDSANQINGKPVYYYKNTSGVDVTADVGEVIFANCTQMSVHNKDLSYGGILLGFTNNSDMEECSINYSSIQLTASHYNNLTGNTIRFTERRDYCIYLSQSSNNNITDNIINSTEVNTYGIYLVQNSNHNNLINNIINSSNQNGHGITVRSSSNNNLLDNTIRISGYSGYGIYLIESSENNSLIKNNILTMDTNGIGIYLAYSSNYNNVTNNVIDTFGTAGYGMLIYNTLINNLTNNQMNLYGAYGHGFFIYYTSTISVIENTINCYGDNGNGIWLRQASENDLGDNTIKTTGAYGYGVRIYESANDNELSNNTISTSGERGYGIFLQESSRSNNIVDNNINTTGLRGYGITISDFSNSNVIIKNSINTTGERGYGIYQYLSDYTKFDGNNISTNGTRGDGIYLQQSTYNNIIKNQVNTIEGGYGIFLYQTSNNNKLISNIIDTNGTNGHGFYFYNSSDNNTLWDNRIVTFGINGHGILLEDSDNNMVLNCTIKTTGIDAYGVYLDGKKVEIINTTISTRINHYDMYIIHEGEITTLNCVFDEIRVIDFGGGVIKVQNYLSVQVYGEDGIIPVHGVDVAVWDNNLRFYASPGYGGFDAVTNTNGRVDNIIVTDRWYDHDNFAIENTTKLNVKKFLTKPWEATRPDINMNTSHTEIFYADITPPPIPTGLKVTRVPGTNTLNLSWDLNTDTVIYQIYASKTGLWEFLVNITHPQNWTLDEDLPDETLYFYKIRAKDIVGFLSNFSEPVSFYLNDITPPVIPVGLSVQPVLGGDALNISWELNPDNPLGYDLSWNDPVIDEWTVIGNVSHPINYIIWTNKSLTNGTKYYFKIRANYKNILPSEFSEAVSVVHRDYLAPKPPTNLDEKSISKNKIELSWSASIDFDVVSYWIYINQSSYGSGGPYNFLTKAYSLSSQVTDLLENSTYYFVIKALDEAENPSQFSDELEANTTFPGDRPFVVTTDPPHNSTSVAVDTSVSITFSLPMNIDSVAKVLEITPDIEYTLSWGKSDTELLIDFKENLSYNTSYTIKIGIAKALTGGILLDWPYILKFITEKEPVTPLPTISLNITSPKSNIVVKPGEIITVSGTSMGLIEGTQITITLGEMSWLSNISAGGTWTAQIIAPEVEGTYLLEVSVGNLSDAVSITVQDDDKEDAEADGANGEYSIFGMGGTFDLIFILAILIIIIILILIIIMRRKPIETAEEPELELLDEEEGETEGEEEEVDAEDEDTEHEMGEETEFVIDDDDVEEMAEDELDNESAEDKKEEDVEKEPEDESEEEYNELESKVQVFDDDFDAELDKELQGLDVWEDDELMDDELEEFEEDFKEWVEGK